LNLTVTKPDATVDSFAIGALTHGGTGSYSYLYTPLTSGAYRYEWLATVPGYASDGTFYIADEPQTVLTLAEVKGHLAITDTAHDSQLPDIITAAVGVVEGLIGPLTPKTYSETYSGGGYSIVLRHVPVISVTSVVESWGNTNYTLTNEPVGGTSDAYGYDLEDPKAGLIVRRTVGGYPFPFFSGMGNIAITYVAGRTSVPPDVKLAVIRQIRDLWSDYQSGRTQGRQNTGPLPYGVSNMVTDLLQPHMMQPGIA
jgi:hypothetical protein